MLTQDEPLYPKNDTCKLCMHKPCRELFKGRVFPGKMIFAHHSRFQSWPCHTPNLKPSEEETEEAAALTDDIEVVSGNVEISNPHWEPLEEAEAGGDPEIPLLGDKVRLLADVKNYAEGAPVSFDVYDVTESTPLRIATVNGTNQGGTASADWTVEDPQKRGEHLKLQFEAGAQSKYTEKTELPWQDKIKCDFVEMPDVLFHHNSAVPCLDEKKFLINAITAVVCYAKENPDKELIVFGHTDTSGDPAYNYDLSQWRAEGIKALLDKNTDAWLDTIDLASKVEDYQAILKALATSHGWSCDPGNIDNKDGPKTRSAVEAFQKEYNRRFDGDLVPDGIMGSKTWEAVFITIHSLIEKAVTAGTEDGTIPEFTYGFNQKGTYACGESFPIVHAEKTNYISASNRRAEIMFMQKGRFTFKSPADRSKKISKNECPIYYEKVKRTPISLPTPSQDDVELKLIYPLKRLKELLSTDVSITRYWLGSVFGRAISNDIFDALTDDVKNDAFVEPACFAIDDASNKLEGHSAAYDEDIATIYVRQSIVDDPAERETLAVILCEEFGHHVENALRKKISETYEAPGDEGAVFARHLLENEQYEDGTVPLSSLADGSSEIAFDRTKIGEVLERLLPEDMIQWEHTSRQLSFSSVFTVDDVVEDEMPGQILVAADDAGTLKKGDEVVVAEWKRQTKNVKVLDSAGTEQTIPLFNFEPKHDSSSTLLYYSVGLSSLRKAILANTAKLQKYEANKPSKPPPAWNAERQRMIDLNEKRMVYYGQMLAREIMYNRFDGNLSRWVTHYNGLLNPKTPLTADIVKSMAFQEGRMGTSGRYFMKPPHSWAFTTEHPIMSRFNLIQALDSGLQQQFLLIEEMDPDFFNTETMSDGRTMNSLKRYAAWKGLKFPDPRHVPTDVALMQEGIEKFARKWAAINGQVIDGVSMGMYTEYDFWIRSAVRWLMEKYLVTVKSSSWNAAVKRYNGGGHKADMYAEAVMKRITGAKGGVVFVGNK